MKTNSGANNKNTSVLMLVILLSMISATAAADLEVREASWEGVINRIYSFPALPPDSNYGLFAQWSSLDQADIVVGATLTGTIRFIVTTAPADSDPEPDVFKALAGADQAIDDIPRWLTLSATLNGNRFEPRLEPRPDGVRTACTTSGASPCWQAGANQNIVRQPLFKGFPFPGFEDVQAISMGDDWDTLFDGIFHEREIALGLESATDGGFPPVIYEPVLPFTDALPGPGENFAGAAFNGTVEVSIWVGDQRDSFQISLDTITDFQVVSPIPEILDGLIGIIISFELHTGTETSLLAKVDSIVGSIEAENIIAAINVVHAFCHNVEAQRDEKISAEQADILIQEANALILSLDETADLCPVL